MPTTQFPILTTAEKATARKADASYPPGGSVTTATNSLIVERGFDSSASQYRIRTLMVRFYVNLPAGSTIISYKLVGAVSAKNDADTLHLAIFDWGVALPVFPPINSGHYIQDPDNSNGDVALSALIVGSNDISVSGLTITTNGYVRLQIGIAGGSPTGLNDLTFTSLALEVTYSSIKAPAQLAIDGDTSSAPAIDRTQSHRFSFNAGQAITGFDLYTKTVAGSYGAPTHYTTPNQYVDIAGGTFAAGDYNWKVVAYDTEGNASPESGQKTFTAGDAVTTPNITAPTSSVATGLPTITITSGTHTKERYRILEGSTVIYDTNAMVQTGNSHALSSMYFKNGKTALEDGKSYTALASVYDSSNVRSAEDSQAFSVVFVPPETPLVNAIAEETFIRLTIDNQGDGSIVGNEIYVSTDYDAATGDGTWLLLDTVDPDATFDWYECKDGEEYWFRARALTSITYADSDVTDAVQIALPVWMVIHVVSDPAGTIMLFHGDETTVGKSDFSRAFAPAVAVQDFLGRAAPSVAREVTAAGVQKGVETWRVTIVLTGKSDEELAAKLTAEALLRTPGSLCIRTADRPVGDLAIGSVTNLAPPVRPDTVMAQAILSFDFVVTE